MPIFSWESRGKAKFLIVPLHPSLENPTTPILFDSNTREMADIQETIELLKRGTVQIFSEDELKEKLKQDRPLRIKLGVDPTSPDLHLGHAVQLLKLRQFQELGHQVVLIIGDFTAQIGDPSGRNSTRPPLSHEDVMKNAKTYMDQAFVILDKDKTEVVHNGDWFNKMNFTDVIKLNGRVTMQQMLQREDFKKRIDGGQEVRLHEIQYPIVQGWDSVMVRSDVEIGGSDQLFNILVGRDLQKAEGMEQQIVMTLPLLEGLDGVKKMSKSYNNYVGLTDSPTDMFGKVMSISDELMPRYYTLCLQEEMPSDLHPLDAKKQLAAKIVAIYHGQAAADEALDWWKNRSQDLAAVDHPEFQIGERRDIIGVVQAAYQSLGQQRSGGESRRLVQQGSVQLDGEKVTDPKAQPAWADGQVLKLDKKSAVKIKA